MRVQVASAHPLSFKDVNLGYEIKSWLLLLRSWSFTSLQPNRWKESLSKLREWPQRYQGCLLWWRREDVASTDTQIDAHSAVIVQPPPSSAESVISTKSGRIKTILPYLCWAAASSDKQPHWFTVSVTDMYFDSKTFWSAVFVWLAFSGATYQTSGVQL